MCKRGQDCSPLISRAEQIWICWNERIFCWICWITTFLANVKKNRIQNPSYQGTVWEDLFTPADQNTTDKFGWLRTKWTAQWGVYRSRSMSHTEESFFLPFLVHFFVGGIFIFVLSCFFTCVNGMCTATFCWLTIPLKISCIIKLHYQMSVI